jgi:hypothetical protein
MLYENELCGDSLQVELQWSGVQNRDALGAQVILHTSAGVLRRDVRVASGYLAGDAARLHFGLPGGATVEQFEIRWPDGASSVVSEGSPNTLMRISR